MSFRKDEIKGETDARKVRGGRVIALAQQFEAEARQTVPDALQRDRRTAKVISIKVGATSKAVEKWRQGENLPSVPYFMALAREVPELRALVCEWLHLSPRDPRFDRLKTIIEEMSAHAPESGDRSND